MIKLLCLFKARFDYVNNIKCCLVAYSFLSFISLIFVSIEFILIFKNLKSCNMNTKSKISFITISILFRIYHNLSFIYEDYIIIRAVKKKIKEGLELQMSERRNNRVKNTNANATKSSDKPKKVESFIKEDTIFIFQGKHYNNSIYIDNKDNKESICIIKNNTNSERQLKTRRKDDEENNKESKESNENRDNHDIQDIQDNLPKRDCFNSVVKINLNLIKS